jgi:CubicO group peptidase (beta-lactamase class C family)
VTRDIKISGCCDDRFKLVEDVFSHHLVTGEDIGASFAVFLDGKPVVDLWGGHVDAGRTKSWNKDTIACVFSSTKFMAAL